MVPPPPPFPPKRKRKKKKSHHIAEIPSRTHGCKSKILIIHKPDLKVSLCQWHVNVSLFPGWGDMAVSNSIGSNVFDILICLGLPWLLQTAAVTPGESLSISSSGLVYSSLTLLGTVVFLIVSLTINGWRLNKPLGVVYLVVYVIVIALTCLYELNVFGDLNPPSCPRPEWLKRCDSIGWKRSHSARHVVWDWSVAVHKMMQCHWTKLMKKEMSKDTSVPRWTISLCMNKVHMCCITVILEGSSKHFLYEYDLIDPGFWYVT